MPTPIATDAYTRIAKSIAYIQANAARQPTLEEMAEAAHLSPFHFQRMFTEWAGVSPKKFLQYLTLAHAKALLRQNAQPGLTLFDTAYQAGLSGTGRLHDLFVNLEGITPGEFRQGGQGMELRYSFGNGLFGPYLLATTSKGIYALRFSDGDMDTLKQELANELPLATLINESDATHHQVAAWLNGQSTQVQPLRLHVKGTPFQLKVWEALLQIPEGAVRSYTAIAAAVGAPTAQRAVGTAIGANPVGYLIPCHRVITSTGSLGGYRWGLVRKAAMLGREFAMNEAGSLKSDSNTLHPALPTLHRAELG